MRKSNIVFNYIYNSIYQILLIILPLITTPYVSRVLGATGVGIYSYTYSVAYCFALVGMVGVNNYGNRTIATYQDNRTKRSTSFWNIYAVQFLAAMSVLLVYMVYIIFFARGDYGIVLYIQVLTVASSLLDINWLFFGLEQFKITVTRNIIVRLVAAICIFVFVNSKDDVWIYTLLMVGSQFIGNLVVWPFLKKYVDFVKPEFAQMKKHMRQMIILFIPVIAVTLYNKMDKVMIGALSNMVQSGYYENVEKIITVPTGLITSLGTVMLPRMSNLFSSGDQKQAKGYIRMSMEFACFMSFALMFGISGIATEFAPVFFGEEFSTVGFLIQLIAPTILFKAWANVIRTQYLIPLKMDKSYVVSVWIGACINLLVNFLLIGKYGAAGAIIGTLCAEGSVMLYQTYSVRKLLPIKEYFFNAIPYFLPGIVMYVIVRMIGVKLGVGVITVIIEISAGVIVYLALCIPIVLKKHKEEIIKLRNKLYKK